MTEFNIEGLTGNEALAGALAALGIFVIFFAIIALAIAIVVIIGKWKFYTKAGEAGWKAIIPYYNDWVLAVDIAGLDWYWFLIVAANSLFGILTKVVPSLAGLSFVAFVASIIGSVCVFYNLSKKMNKSTGWLVCGVIFGDILLAIEGFSKNSTFDKSVEVPKNGVFDKNK